MDTITEKLEWAGVVAESNRLFGSSLNAKDRNAILNARKEAEMNGWDRDMIEATIEDGRARAREKYRRSYY